MVKNTEANSFMSNLASTLARSNNLNLHKDEGLGGIDAQYALALPSLTKYAIETLGNNDSAIINFYKETVDSIIFSEREGAGSNVLAAPSINKVVSMLRADKLKQADDFVETRRLASVRM